MNRRYVSAGQRSSIIASPATSATSLSWFAKSTRQEQQQAAKPHHSKSNTGSEENSRPLGRSIAHRTGSLSTAIGSNVAHTTVTGSLRTVIVATLARATRFVVGGYPRFQYGGFWLSVVDPWPEYWSEDWYDNDVY
jgi:hypothetical protein